MHPDAVTSCNVDLENLISDNNRSIATLAITTLLKVSHSLVQCINVLQYVYIYTVNQCIAIYIHIYSESMCFYLLTEIVLNSLFL